VPIFEESYETILSRVLERLEQGLETREGSFAYDMAAPLCFELWRVLMTFDQLVESFYVGEDSGGYLDKHAALLGLSRREGTKATATIHFVGKAGTVVPGGLGFYTEEGQGFSLTDDTTIGSDGTAVGQVVANQVGDAGNIEGGELASVMRTIAGLSSYFNEAASGGTDPETDADLFSRIDDKRKNPPTSGNEASYREWALSRDGVGDCRVDRLWNGPGTVRVLLVGYDGGPVEDGVVEDCAGYIEEQRPVGAEVTVISAQGVSISVTAAVTLASGGDLEGVRTDFKAKLASYLMSVSKAAFERLRTDRTAEKTCTVYYNRVGALLMEVEGVTDFSGLRLNGGTSNIVTGETEVPVAGEVTLT
jgi:uncharacterized phage protein gp47/JayE